MTDRVDLEAIKSAAEDLRGVCSDQGYRDALAILINSTPALVAELAVLRAQRDATLAECDAAVAEYDKAAAEATTRDADSPAAASRRGLAGGAFLMATAVRAALGVQPEPDNG